MSERVARCCCGQLSATCAGEPARVSMCHCVACQQRTGSVVAVQALFPRDQVAFAGRATVYQRTGDGGGQIRFSFCPECGGTVYYELDGMPGWVAVPVGAFGDPDFPPPTTSIYEARQHPWLALPASVVHHLD